MVCLKVWGVDIRYHVWINNLPSRKRKKYLNSSDDINDFFDRLRGFNLSFSFSYSSKFVINGHHTTFKYMFMYIKTLLCQNDRGALKCYFDCLSTNKIMITKFTPLS